LYPKSVRVAAKFRKEKHVGFYVLTAETMKSSVLGDVSAKNIVSIFRVEE
jgi:hypothetical protein